MKKPEGIQLLWKDRKRICGLPLTFTKYSVSEDRLFYEVGLFTTHLDEILLYRVLDISLRITLWQRLFGVGTIILKSSDKSLPELPIKNIKNPKYVKELIHQQVETMKLTRKMRFGEIVDDPYHYESASPLSE